MKFFLKDISAFLLIFLFLSCDGLSDIFSTNFYQGIDKRDEVSISNSELINWGADERAAKVDHYASIALSRDDSEALFSILKNDPEARAQLILNFNYILDNYPDLTNPEEVDRYQKVAAALAKIEILSTNATFISGAEELIVSYASGENDGNFDADTVLTEVFNIPYSYSSPEEKEQKRSEVLIELTALMNGGLAYEKLGSTITDFDRPESNYISEEDAILVASGAMVNKVVKNTTDNTALTREQAIYELVDGMLNRDFTGSQILFPTSSGVTSTNNMELYLGDGASKTFTATGFELPPVNVLGGV